MASTYSTRIRLEKQAAGENPNSWGDLLNQNVIDLVDQAIAAYTTVALSAVDVTLTANNGSADQSRSPFIELAGTVSASLNLVLPSVSKGYLFNNKLTYENSATVQIKTIGGTGITAAQGAIFLVVCDGVSVYSLNGASFGLSSTYATLSATNGFTGLNTFSSITNLNGAVSASGAVSFGNTFAVSGAATFKQVVGPAVTLTDAASVVPNMSQGNNFYLQITSAVGTTRVITNPTNSIPGQTGQIYLIQATDTGSKTASFGSSYKFPSGTAPTISTSIGAVDLVVYNVRSSTAIDAVIIQDFK